MERGESEYGLTTLTSHQGLGEQVKQTADGCDNNPAGLSLPSTGFQGAAAFLFTSTYTAEEGQGLIKDC